jgi:integrase
MTTPPVTRQSRAKTNGGQLGTMPCPGCGGARKIVLPPIVFDCPTCSASIERPASPIFVSERGSPFTTAGFTRMIERAAAGAGLELKSHPHMLRHACGYALAKGHNTRAIQGWLGHRSITSTAVYTALAPNRFKDLWRV